MKTRELWNLGRLAVATSLALLLATSTFAQVDPLAGSGRNYDAREEAQRQVVRSAGVLQESGLAGLRAQVPGLQYRIDPATGATRTLMSSGSYLTGPSGTDALTSARFFLERQVGLLGLDASDLSEITVSDIIPSGVSGSTHVYLQQRHAGLGVYNALYQTNLDRDGRITGITNGFMPSIASSVNTLQPRLRAPQAIAAAAQHLGISLAAEPRALGRGEGVEQITPIDPAGISGEPINARLMILPIRAGEARLVWNFQVYTLDHQHWFDINVDAETGKVWTRFDWVATDQYRVYAAPAESPNHVQGGLPLPPADGRTLIVDPADPTASPSTWHSGNLTEGNNVRAYDDSNNTNSGTPVDCGASQNCDFPVDLTQPPSAYRPAAVANLFYWNNIIHDVMYQYGFDEASGNFQENNFGNGGAGSDSVNAEAQDGGGTNNANFATPADGANPRMQMYVWTAPNPDKDGDFDNGIVIHEYGHGISNRLVGGPNNVNCLGNSQQAGEGWSDWFALALTAEVGDAGTDPRGIGTYALDEPTSGPGIRTQRYSTDPAVNTWTYESIRSAVVPHGVGSVWAQATWEVYWALVDQYGFDPDLYNATGGAGNQRALLYVTEGLKNTSCSPTFLDGRDGIIQAVLNNNPADECLVWQAFADFGLGINATTTGSNSSATNGFDVPAQCLCNPQPVADAGPDQTICLGDSATVGTPAQPNNTYSWSPGGETTAEITVSPTTSTSYTVTATTTCGSANDSATVTVDDGSGGGLSEDFEGGLGNWADGGLWHLTTSSSCAAPGYSSPFNAIYYGQDGTCNYSTGAANSGNLVSPPITGITASSTMSFDYYRQVESFAGDYDWTRVDVSSDSGATWTNVWSRNARDASAAVWQSSGSISLASFAGSTIQVRFNFDSVDSVSNTFTGWLIDDVVVTGESQCTGGGNTAPVADSQSVAVDEDSSVAVTLTASDIDGDPLTYSVTSGPSNGGLSGTAPNLIYTPNPDYSGPDGFTFVANDGVVNSSTATVSITVNPVADAPVADDQATATDEDVAVAIVLTASDADGDALTYSVLSGPINGSLSGAAPSLTYTPNADYNGSDSFTFVANDGTANSNTATVTITVNPVNDAPIADDQATSVDEDSSVAITLTASDIDSGSLGFTVTTGPSNGTLSGTTPNLTYSPNADYSGPDSFTFVASDGSLSSNTATVSITVNPVNDAPVADDQSTSVDEDSSVAITLSASDVDGDSLGFTVTGGPTNGSLSGAAPNLTYTPNADYNGSDSFTFVANDGTTDSNAATVSITVNATNDAPVADDQSVGVDEDSSVAVTLTASDVDGDTLSFSVAAGPTNGSLSGAAPNLTYTPNADYNGADSFTFVANDGSANSNTATVSITIGPINDLPIADDQSVATPEDTPRAITLTASDIDGDLLTYAVSSGPSNGSLSGAAPNLTYTPNSGYNGPDSFTFVANDGAADSNTATVSITVSNVNNPPVADDQSVSVDEDSSVAITLIANDADGDPLGYSVTSGPSNGTLSGSAPNLSYSPNTNYNGPDSFTFVANDGTGNSNTATVTIAVNPINDPPVADAQSVSVDQDSSVAITLTGSDVDGDLLGFVILTGPSNGSLTGTPPNVTYAPNPGFGGSDGFSFAANDGTISSGPATVSITVNPIANEVTATFTSIGTEDGWVRESSENSNVGGKNNSGGAGSRPIRTGDDRRDRQWRSILSFDTSSIPAGATITSATIRVRRGQVRGTNPYSTHGTLLADVMNGVFGGSVALQNSDFEAGASAPGAAVLSNAAFDGDYSEGSVDGSGLGAINTGGRTQVRLAFTLDDNDDRSEDSLNYRSGDDGSAANRPELVVTYIP